MLKTCAIVALSLLMLGCGSQSTTPEIPPTESATSLMVNANTWLYAGETRLSLPDDPKEDPTAPALIVVRENKDGTYRVAWLPYSSSSVPSNRWEDVRIDPHNSWSTTLFLDGKVLGKGQTEALKHPAGPHDEWQFSMSLRLQGTYPMVVTLTGPKKFEVIGGEGMPNSSIEESTIRRVSYEEFKRQAETAGLTVFLGQ